MPRGIKGSGPYSKFKTVENDLAASLRPAPAKKTTAKKRTARKAPAKKAAPRKAAPAATTTVVHNTTVNNGNGHASVLSVSAVSVQADGTISFIGEEGKIQKIQVAPTYLLTLETKVKEATDEFVKNLVASRS